MFVCQECGKQLKIRAASHREWCGKPFDEQGAFWDRLERLPWSGCWIWMGPKYSTGYGVLWYAPIRGRPGQQIGAHRLAWMLTNGPIPDGLQVLHRCDEPFCCNPDHLFLGTRLDNMDDMASKERRASKLSHNDVRAIRRLLAAGGKTQGEIGAMFGVHASAVSAINCGHKWANVA